MADNMEIDIIPANSFQGITEEYVDMWVRELKSFFPPTSKLKGTICYYSLGMFLDAYL